MRAGTGRGPFWLNNGRALLTLHPDAHGPHCPSFTWHATATRLTRARHRSYLHSLEVGDTVRLRAPFGTATHARYFPEPASTINPGPTSRPTHVFVAGGIGITPVRTLAAISVAQGHKVLVLHANRKTLSGGHPLAQELQELVEQSEGSVYVRGDRAVISVEKLRDLIADHSIDCSGHAAPVRSAASARLLHSPPRGIALGYEEHGHHAGLLSATQSTCL